MQSQQLMRQGRTWELPTSSKQQPSSFARRRPARVEAGLGALVLAALGFTLVLAYGAADALATRNGYAEMALRREIEDVRARNAVLRYQINLARSQQSIAEVADRLGMQAADPVNEVDYVVLSGEKGATGTRMAAGEPGQEPARLAAALGALATEVVSGAGGEAEASTGKGHRQ